MDEKAMDILEKLHRLEALLRRYQGLVFRTHGPWGNPMKGQGRVLAILKLQPVISQKELSYLLDMRQQSLSELLAKLEKNGFITRAPSQEDKRVTMVTLTEEGRAAAEANPDEEADLGRAFDGFTPEEQAQFGEYLDRLCDALEETLGAAEQNAPDFADIWAAKKDHPFVKQGMEHLRKHMNSWGCEPGDWGGDPRDHCPHGRGGPRGGGFDRREDGGRDKRPPRDPQAKPEPGED